MIEHWQITSAAIGILVLWFGSFAVAISLYGRKKNKNND
jgi:hypothetical protein